MLLIVGTVRLPPEKLHAARPIMEEMIKASRAEVGCLAYSYSQDMLEPGLIHVNEAWQDRATLETHFASDHLAAWRARWEDLGIHDRNLNLYEAGKPSEI